METISEALELLRIAQNNMGPDRDGLDDDDLAHWNRISKCREGLERLKQQKPVAWAVFADNGNIRIWSSASESVRKLAEDEGMKLVPLYAVPVHAAVPDGWKMVPVNPTQQQILSALRTPGCDVMKIYSAMLSAAPAAPAVPDDTVKDAERYRLVRRGQHWSVINGIGDDLRAEALDDAIDTEIQKGGA